MSKRDVLFVNVKGKIEIWDNVIFTITRIRGFSFHSHLIHSYLKINTFL